MIQGIAGQARNDSFIKPAMTDAFSEAIGGELSAKIRVIRVICVPYVPCLKISKF